MKRNRSTHTNNESSASSSSEEEDDNEEVFRNLTQNQNTNYNRINDKQTTRTTKTISSSPLIPRNNNIQKQQITSYDPNHISNTHAKATGSGNNNGKTQATSSSSRVIESVEGNRRRRSNSDISITPIIQDDDEEGRLSSMPQQFSSRSRSRSNTATKSRSRSLTLPALSESESEPPHLPSKKKRRITPPPPPVQPQPQEKERQEKQQKNKRPTLYEEDTIEEEYTQQSIRHRKELKVQNAQEEQQEEEELERESQRLAAEQSIRSRNGKSQSQKSRNQYNNNNKEKEKEKEDVVETAAGTIEEIILINFMCHLNFSVKLYPGFNFISGGNGSGKSTLILALTLLLGGNASNTERGSLKEFIRKPMIGEELLPGRISVRLCNLGLGSYRFEEFGDNITIVRNLLLSGGSSYKILDHQGVTRGTTVTLIRDIVESHGLSITNPLTFLSQERAKTFYREITGNPSKLYQFWNETTGLSSLLKNLKAIEKNLLDVREIRVKLGDVIKHLINDEKEAGGIVKRSGKILKMRDEIRSLESKLKWRKVDELERILQAIQERYQMALVDYTESKDEMKIKQQALEAALEAQVSKLAERDTFEASIHSLDVEASEAREALKKKHFELKEINNQFRILARQLESRQDTLASAKESLESIQSNQDNETHLVELEQKLNYLRNELILHENSLTEQQDLLTLAEDEQEREVNLDKERDPFENDLNQVRTKLRNDEKELNSIQNIAQQPIDRFGHGMSKLLAAIKAEKRWRIEPIGPVGNFITIKDPKFAAVIEAVIGGVLADFICMTAEDYKRLMEMKKRFNVRFGVIRRYQDSTWVLKNQPVESQLTILRALSFSDSKNSEVLRYIVDGSYADVAALVPLRPDGDKLMKFNRPHETHISSCYSADGFKLGGMNGGNASIALTLSKGRPILSEETGDKSAAIANLQRSISNSKVNINTLINKSAAWKRSTETLNNEKKKKLFDLRIAVRDAARLSKGVEADIREVEEELNQASPQEEVETLRQQIKVAEQQLASTQEAQFALEANQLEIQAQETELRTNYDEAKNRVDMANGQVRAFDSAIENLTEAAAKAKRSVGFNLESHDKSKKKTRKLLEEVEQASTVLATALEVAEELPPRIQVRESEEALKSRLRSVTATIDGEREKPGFDQALAEETYLVAREKVDAATNSINELALYDKALSSALASRNISYEAYQQTETSKVKLHFTHTLQEFLLCDGKLKISHQEQEMELDVDRQGRDCSNLSGGERSKEQLLLLISFWRSVASPVRILDEYTVFADVETQKAMLNAMLKNATTVSQNSQYILISPLLSVLTPEQAKTVHRIHLRK